MTMNQYDKFLIGKKQLLSIAEDTSEVLSAIDQTKLLENIDQLKSRLGRDTFKVMILGEFKRGKSTFINSLLGEEILPAFATPCTAVINEIKFAEEKSAVLHFRDDVKPEDVLIYTDEVKAHVNTFSSGGQVPPLQIDINDLEDYVTIPFEAEDERAALAQSPYTHAEIYWPLELCQNGVELIDSPGLNEHSTRTAVTSDYLNKVDAVVFVMSGTAMASKSELDVIRTQVRPSGHEHLFFVINRFDEIRERERPRVMKHAYSKLSPLTKLEQDGIFFTSAFHALQGRLNNDLSKVEESGVPKFEEVLASYLVNDRFKIKMFRPLVELSKAVSEAKLTVPMLESNLMNGLASLESKYLDIKPILERAEGDINQVSLKIRRAREKLRNNVERIVSERQRSLYHIVLEQGKYLVVETDFTFFGNKKELVREITEEVVGEISQHIESDQEDWNEKYLSPLIEQGLSELENTIDEDISSILDQVNKANSVFNRDVTIESEDTSALEKVLAGAGGFIIGGVGSAFIGGTFGFKEMARSILPQIGIIVGLSLVGLTNPFILIPALLTGGFIQGVLKGDMLKNKIRDKVVQKIADDFRSNANQVGTEVAHEVFEKTEVIETEIRSNLELEVQKIREKYESSKSILQAGQSETDEKIQILKGQSIKLESLSQRIMQAQMELINS